MSTPNFRVLITLDPDTNLLQFTAVRPGVLLVNGQTLIAFILTTPGWAGAYVRASTKRFGSHPAPDVATAVAELMRWTYEYSDRRGLDLLFNVTPGLIPAGV